jgi:hypothetical protein
MAKMPIAVTECRLLRSSAGSRDTKNHFRAAVQLDILVGAEQNAGSLGHPGILLPRRVVRQQHAGNRRGGDGDVAGSGYDGSRCRGRFSCGSCPGIAARGLRRATRPAAAISRTRARVRGAARRRGAHGGGRCSTPRWSDRLNLRMDWQVLTALQLEVIKLERDLGILGFAASTWPTSFDPLGISVPSAVFADVLV